MIGLHFYLHKILIEHFDTIITTAKLLDYTITKERSKAKSSNQIIYNYLFERKEIRVSLDFVIVNDRLSQITLFTKINKEVIDFKTAETSLKAKVKILNKTLKFITER